MTLQLDSICSLSIKTTQTTFELSNRQQRSVEAMASPVTDDDVLAELGVLLVKMKQKKRKHRAEWCKKWLMKRKQFTHTNLLQELRTTHA